MNTENKQRRFSYAWVIVALCFLMVFTCLGFCSSGKSLYLTAITKALGIKRSAFSINDSCRYVTTAIVNIFFSKLILKYGQKKLIAAGFLSLILSCLIYSYAKSIYVFYLGGALLGLGLSWTTTTMVSSIVYKWCHKNQGTIMGAVLASNGLGGALAAQIVSPIIYRKSDLFGYQDAYRLVALILLIVGILVMLFLKEAPKDQLTPVKNSPKKKTTGEIWSGIGYTEAIRKPYFYGAAICIFFTGMILQGITTVAVPHMTDLGMDTAYVAAILSLSSLTLAGCKFLTGFIFDRFGLRVSMNISLFASLVVLLVLIFITNTPFGKILAIVYAFLNSVALPLETIMLPLYASALFGQRSFDKILSIFVSVNTAGYALGTPIVNWCFDAFGSYRPAFVVSLVIMLCVAIALQFVFRTASREKQIFLTQENM